MSDAFPTMVYKVPGPHFGPAGKTFDAKGIANAEALRLALGAGWHRTLPEACNPPAPLSAHAKAFAGFTLADAVGTVGDIIGLDFRKTANVEDEASASPFLPPTITSTPDDVSVSDDRPEDSAEMRIAVADVLPTRAELDAEAKSLGLHLNKRTSDADLAKRIADTKARVPHMGQD